MYPILLNSPLFRGLTAEELSLLFGQVKHQVRHFRAGELLAQAGDPVEKALLLMEGRLQGEMVDFAGNSLKIEELEPPQMVAAAFLYGPKSKFPVFLSAKTDGMLLIIHKKDFTDMLSFDVRVMVNYLNIVSGKAQFLTGKITFLSLKSIREKIAYFIMQRMNKSGNTHVPIDQTQTNLADLFGVTRPSLSRTIMEMEKQGIFIWSRDHIVIKDQRKFNSILGRYPC
ncbi:MAG: Crp/Fnr family transcriptional regulator [Prolixibacteraceae bacterium]|jgi:CRP-like cAMP-binding protein|nr:Crp/Fnr family transcriptional regulator [Prolixibacteraceae bacterium]